MPVLKLDGDKPSVNSFDHLEWYGRSLDTLRDFGKRYVPKVMQNIGTINDNIHHGFPVHEPAEKALSQVRALAGVWGRGDHRLQALVSDAPLLQEAKETAAKQIAYGTGDVRDVLSGIREQLKQVQSSPNPAELTAHKELSHTIDNVLRRLQATKEYLGGQKAPLPAVDPNDHSSQGQPSKGFMIADILGLDKNDAHASDLAGDLSGDFHVTR
ncbi:hypothetical protein [Rhodoligotrophos ferricapiens]|uniref:hypothetical protein n=1 Tax=Rhodoligotrophos ferricapiens TaxID=3069264 RepID=UPI00315D2ECB